VCLNLEYCFTFFRTSISLLIFISFSLLSGLLENEAHVHAKRNPKRPIGLVLTDLLTLFVNTGCVLLGHLGP
jgi:hypothetical protein